MHGAGEIDTDKTLLSGGSKAVGSQARTDGDATQRNERTWAAVQAAWSPMWLNLRGAHVLTVLRRRVVLDRNPSVPSFGGDDSRSTERCVIIGPGTSERVRAGVEGGRRGRGRRGRRMFEAEDSGTRPDRLRIAKSRSVGVSFILASGFWLSQVLHQASSVKRAWGTNAPVPQCPNAPVPHTPHAPVSLPSYPNALIPTLVNPSSSNPARPLELNKARPRHFWFAGHLLLGPGA